MSVASPFRSAPARPPHLAGTSMDASSQPTATAAGLRMLREGGSAADAILAAAGALCVSFRGHARVIHAQAHVQLVHARSGESLDLQTALDRPRLRLEDRRFLLEEGLC